MIEIPGYRIVRPLGRGGMASVHLAIQESVQREVALKIMAPTLMGDPQFGERFLREARIAARLHHPHVVQVHDVGVAGDCHYMAMEYLPGGPVIAHAPSPHGPRHALRICREMAAALGYAHARGVIHRDIKPDNILLREDGTAVLTDFGIARASDSVRMTMTGSIMGTPSYMSPEQARGDELDGRSDLYSLGVVFYELLTGRVPYTAGDALSVGLMHLSAPIPRLPGELDWLQPVLERMLAKSADHRFASGADLEAALAELEQRFTPTPLRPIGGLRTPPPTVPVAHSTPPAAVAREPSLGAIDLALANDPGQARHGVANAAHPRDWRPLAWPLLAIVAAAALWFGINQWRGAAADPTASALERAELALAQGRLVKDASGDGARDLFAAVIAIDPDNARAHAGLQRVGEQWLQRAREAVAEGRLEAADKALAEARALGLAAAVLEPVERERAALDAKTSEPDDWFDAARREQASGNLDGNASSALALYQRALRLNPGHAGALQGIQEVLSALLQQGQQQLAAGDVAAAEQRLLRVAEVDDRHPQLAELRNAIAAAQVAQGEQARVQQLQGQFERALADLQLPRAGDLLEQLARRGRLPATRLAEFRARYETAERRHQTLQQNLAQANNPALVERLLDEADAAIRLGNLWGPPGDSAYDKLRRLQSSDPRNAQAAQAMQALPEHARRHFDAAISAGRLERARGYLLDLHNHSNGGHPALAGMRQRLAQAYAGSAEKALAAANPAAARAALEQVRSLDPGYPALADLQARLDADAQ